MKRVTSGARGKRTERLPIGHEIKWGDFRGMRKFETSGELPPAYDDLMVKLLHVQASSELMSVLTFRDYLDRAPTLDDRWAVARVTADEMRQGMQFHIAIGVNGFRRMIGDPHYDRGREEAQALVDRWYPGALDMFGHSGSAASRQAIAWGIKKWDNDEVRAMYVDEVGRLIADLGLITPADTANRRVR